MLVSELKWVLLIIIFQQYQLIHDAFDHIVEIEQLQRRFIFSLCTAGCDYIFA